MAPDLTPTQKRIFDLLSDGAIHAVDEIRLIATNGRRFTSDSLVPTHIGRLRAALKGSAFSITNEAGLGYRMTEWANNG